MYTKLIIISNKQQKKPIRLSSVFRLYLYNWWIFMFTSLIFNIYMVCRFNEPQSTTSLFGWGLSVQLTIMISPITVFFVVLERNLVFLLPFKQQILRWWLIRIEFVVLAAFYCLFVCELLWVTQSYSDYTDCRAFGCLMNRKGGSVHLSIKIAMSIGNIVNMICFIVALRGMNKTACHKRTNRLAIIVICMELVWNIIPLILTNILIISMNWNIAAYIGPYVQTLTAIDGLLSSILYTNNLTWPSDSGPNPSIRSQKPFMLRVMLAKKEL
ncbi:unnamed protein product [Bursaphelenchus okinawaensis]|uniref:Uncharacterized protein n=1 Tax=Bursaphelenchus okinawaensis TaxID=465554 RepID=A0A811K1M4_9BILA|nr:unnamed protein product [Bursaphelenchus okinawaensis]CAG9089034.1 unnamed protein product [Bursaphelenchus okinawaensis]